MPTESGRYQECETAAVTVAGPDGSPRTVAYLRRRFLPPLPADAAPAAGVPTLAESGLQITAVGQTMRAHVVDAGDRLDTLAWLALGDPLLFWQIADANPCLFPDELTADPGAVIAVPEAAGRSAAAARLF